MPDQIDLLQQLQTLDAELYRLRKSRVQKPLELEQARERVSAEEAKLKDCEERTTSLQLQQKEQEIELQSLEGKVKKLQGQLLQLKTNKEYTAMQHEIDTFKADNSLLEETILKAFDAIDQAVKDRRAQEAFVTEERKRLDEDTARVEREITEIGRRADELERQRQGVTPGVPPPTLSEYERILSNREGLALVPLMDESCGGCYRRLPPQIVNEVYLRSKLVKCESCNRILFKKAEY